ncbi:hypothetical protein SAMN02910353_02804 [Ruminococcus sp. YRD2003]|nr:hypothetical protein SAMN02910353_02804 [Ruminococcus flavefaciens]
MEEMSKTFMEKMQAAAAKGPSLEEVKAVLTPHGKLVRCSYFASSCGMAFNSNTLLDISVVLADGVQKISYTEKKAFHPTVATVYIPKQDVLAEVQALVERENLAAWSALEYHDPFQCTDYSSSASISLNFDDSPIGGRKSVRAVVNVSAACQHGGGEVIQQFRDILETAVQDAEDVSRTESGSSMLGLGMMGMLTSPPQSPNDSEKRFTRSSNI